MGTSSSPHYHVERLGVEPTSTLLLPPCSEGSDPLLLYIPPLTCASETFSPFQRFAPAVFHFLTSIITLFLSHGLFPRILQTCCHISHLRKKAKQKQKEKI